MIPPFYADLRTQVQVMLPSRMAYTKAGRSFAAGRSREVSTAMGEVEGVRIEIDDEAGGEAWRQRYASISTTRMHAKNVEDMLSAGRFLPFGAENPHPILAGGILVLNYALDYTDQSRMIGQTGPLGLVRPVRGPQIATPVSVSSVL